MVLKQSGAGPELVHCHVTLRLEAFIKWAMTSVGVGGAGIVVNYFISMRDELQKNFTACTKVGLPLSDKEVILWTLVLALWLPLALTQMSYFVLHWRLGKVVLTAIVVLPTVYFVTEPPSGWEWTLTRLTHMGRPWLDHCHDTLILVLSEVASADTLIGVGISVQWNCHHQTAAIN